MISLCNIIYKFISKIIVNCLKPLLSSIISLEQIGFVEIHYILDGIIISCETIYFFKKEKKARMLIKLDTSNAYDKLSWDYLLQVLWAFCFFEYWIKWIGSLKSTPLFFILYNGSPTSTFNTSRQIYQEDPLPSFLFILVAKCLGRSIKATMDQGKLKRIMPI